MTATPTRSNLDDFDAHAGTPAEEAAIGRYMALKQAGLYDPKATWFSIGPTERDRFRAMVPAAEKPEANKGGLFT